MEGYAPGEEHPGGPSTPTPDGREDSVAVLVGSYVSKDSLDRRRFLVGKVASFDESSGLYGVVYEDGHREELGRKEVLGILVVEGEGRGSGIKLTCKKRKLDQLLSSSSSAHGDVKMPAETRPRIASDGIQSSSLCGANPEPSEDADSSSNSCDTEHAPHSPSNLDTVILELPPSSGDISVPEESISYLFSVYNFLRSFSIQLFLSPFSLDDFVGSLNCVVQNSLLDAIHVSLMRALKNHLQILSSEGSELEEKCLRYHDWNLLDTLTWPILLVEYLFLMGYRKSLGAKGLGILLSKNEYYRLPVETKLKVLQILCDHVMDSAELRSELETRENMEEDIDDGIDAIFPQENAKKMQKSTERDSVLKSKVTEPDADISNAASDGNSDECRLCGMDGTLICCDGCPSAYHSRCIGLNKSFLPDGLWYCRECSVEKLGPPSSRIGRGINGGETFGIDAYGRMFLGTCNYLLVTQTSPTAEPFSRYYNQSDAAKILELIFSSQTTALMYADICEGLSRYLELPSVMLQALNHNAGCCFLVDKEQNKNDVSHSITLQKTPNSYNIVVGQHEFSNTVIREDVKRGNQELFILNSTVSNSQDAQKPVAEINRQILMKSSGDNNEATSSSFKKHEQFPSASKISSVNQTMDDSSTAMSYSNKEASAERSSVWNSISCFSTNENGVCKGAGSSSCLSTNSNSLLKSDVHLNGSQVSGIQSSSASGRFLSASMPFKPHAYVNFYIHGDVAASAAANLAVLMSEENKSLEVLSSSNPRKMMAATMGLQMKAFSGAVIQFLWPSSDKRLMDIPRERCGWCLACKTPSTSKKGCFLNVAAANAIKGSARNISGIRLKPEDTQFAAIAAYIANMEESLHGLLGQSFIDAEYRKQWNKRLREAFSCRLLKLILLEFERNILEVAFSPGWFKLVNDGSAASSANVGTSRSAPYQKRGPGARRNKKHLIAESAIDSADDSWKDVHWWRGGKLSRVVFQNATLPSAYIKKAARQGGSRRISGISYPENDLPRRSRQLAWRASVEVCKNASQLALQVRYLDAHIRWKDLVRPELLSLDVKALDADASAFRNAVVCDKKDAGNKTIYALTFANQKHLSLRIAKSILEEEDDHGGNSKLWFSENHIPLYLIREYEEKIIKKAVCYPMKLSPLMLTKFQLNPLKVRRRNIFSYLIQKRDEPRKHYCVSCKEVVALRDASTCSICEGYCHKDCTLPLIDRKGAELAYSFPCKICYHAKTAALKGNRQEILNSRLSSQKQDKPDYGNKFTLQISSSPSIAQSAPKVMIQPTTGPVVSNSKAARKTVNKTSQSFGLVWKRKQAPDTGIKFRLENIILKSEEGINPSISPICCLCSMPYRSDLMYVCCEKCQNWYHADALQLEETQIFDLIGFKCCKCRRKGSPKCPYSPDYKDSRQESTKSENVPEGTTIYTSKLPQSSMQGVQSDPLVYSFGIIESITQHLTENEDKLNGSGLVLRNQQKLSVRRPHAKWETDFEDSYMTQDADTHEMLCDSHFVGSNYVAQGMSDYEPLVEWDNSGGCEGVTAENTDSSCAWQGTEGGNLGDTEYEPQTYFSFTELLASEDGQVDESYEPMDENSRFQPSIVDTSKSFYEEATGFNDPRAAEVDCLHDDTAVEEVAFVVDPCAKCKLNQPPPQLLCEICGLLIHSECSPWLEDQPPSSDGSWSCGNCRDWR